MDHTTAEQRRAARERSRTECAERRNRVLRYPDLRERLIRLGVNPDTWNGYVPPRTAPEDDCDRCGGRQCAHTRARANRSYVRRELVAVCTEALRRDTQPAFDELDQAPADTS